MQLAKNVIDIELSTNNLEPMLRFWQQDAAVRFDHVLPVSERRIAMAVPTKPGSEDSSIQTVLNAFDTLFNKRDYGLGRALLVAALHPAQRTYSTRPRRALWPGQDLARDAALREPHCGGDW